MPRNRKAIPRDRVRISMGYGDGLVSFTGEPGARTCLVIENDRGELARVPLSCFLCRFIVSELYEQTTTEGKG